MNSLNMLLTCVGVLTGDSGVLGLQLTPWKVDTCSCHRARVVSLGLYRLNKTGEVSTKLPSTSRSARSQAAAPVARLLPVVARLAQSSSFISSTTRLGLGKSRGSNNKNTNKQ